MKNVLVLCVLLGLSSCKFYTPTFKSLSNWRVSNVSANKVTLSSTATFNNPNSFGGLNLSGMNIALNANGKSLGVVNTNTAGIPVSANSDFKIPFSIDINPQDLVGNLGNILDMAMGKKVDIQCIGDLKVGYSMFHKTISINQTVPVSIKDLK